MKTLGSVVLGMVSAFVLALTSQAQAEPSVGTIELCVRGDDMGHTRDVNLAFIKTHEEGILTSASLMPAAPYFDDAVTRCKSHPKLAAGVHVTLMATVPMRPILPPEEVPSLVAPDGFLHHNLEDLVKAQPKIEELEKEIRAQIKKCLDTGLRICYIDWHMASGGGTKRPDLFALYPRLADEHRLLFTEGDVEGKYCGAKLVQAGLESWKSQRLPDGNVVYWNLPMAPEARGRFLQKLNDLQPGTWYTYCHPGLVSQGQAESVKVLCSDEVRQILRNRGIQLISFADLWKRKYGN